MALRAANPLPSTEAILEWLDFNPETGIFTWREHASRSPHAQSHWAGTRAGSLLNGEYLTIKLLGRRYLAHRLVWKITHGADPAGQIDHINGVKTDNRPGNLREASRAENARNRPHQRNSKTGIKGVRYAAKHNRWRAQITYNGKAQYLGSFASKEEARAAYATAAERLFGNFAWSP